jgi:N-hydroxyarylamine O-acetyltransferase
MDIEAYFARIGYCGSRAPTLETLRALHTLHPAAIPFENIDVLLGLPIDLAPAAVDAKLIGNRRGGYCYEQNGLFKRALATLGFSVEGLGARVLWQVPGDAPPRPKTHMALRVMIDGVPWLADVGFGGCVPTVPLRLDSTAPQASPHESFRITPDGGDLLIEAELGDRWAALYRLDPAPMLDIDYELGNWFVSSHPQSHFRQRLMVSRVTPEARTTLQYARLSVRRSDGSVDQLQLDATEIEATLAGTFNLPFDPEWRPLVERMAVSGL